MAPALGVVVRSRAWDNVGLRCLEAAALDVACRCSAVFAPGEEAGPVGVFTPGLTAESLARDRREASRPPAPASVCHAAGPARRSRTGCRRAASSETQGAVRPARPACPGRGRAPHMCLCGRTGRCESVRPAPSRREDLRLCKERKEGSKRKNKGGPWPGRIGPPPRQKSSGKN